MGFLKFCNLSGTIFWLLTMSAEKAMFLKLDNNKDLQARCKFLHLCAYNLQIWY